MTEFRDVGPVFARLHPGTNVTRSTVRVTEPSHLARLRPGQRVYASSTDGRCGALREGSVLVKDVDHDTGEITVHGTWNCGIPAIAAGDYLFPGTSVDVETTNPTAGTVCPKGCAEMVDGRCLVCEARAVAVSNANGVMYGIRRATDETRLAGIRVVKRTCTCRAYTWAMGVAYRAADGMHFTDKPCDVAKPLVLGYDPANGSDVGAIVTGERLPDGRIKITDVKREPSAFAVIEKRFLGAAPPEVRWLVTEAMAEAYALGKSTTYPEPVLERGCTVLSHERAISDAMRLAAETRDLLAENATLRRRVERLEKRR